jgi:hypothetical protein
MKQDSRDLDLKSGAEGMLTGKGEKHVLHQMQEEGKIENLVTSDLDL